ncbi:hypothetical protein [Campylobacter ureolyticus]|uniref:hypothetical protein n=1 Tax=Campylobacter ureolyticus TaxID=827 RepID=UPI0029087202|nr:hypothetical protein [Campylobacter ureolyticus]MDU7070063.1 hypothetical protein [Campylobacter ureolyticus]
MNELVFRVPLKITSDLSLNKIYSGIFWAKRKKQKDDIKTLVKIALKNEKIIKFNNPVEIEMLFNSRLDVSNHAYVFKMIEDAIKELGIIKDDTDKYVKKCTMLKQRVFDGIVVCIMEYE